MTEDHLGGPLKSRRKKARLIVRKGMSESRSVLSSAGYLLCASVLSCLSKNTCLVGCEHQIKTTIKKYFGHMNLSIRYDYVKQLVQVVNAKKIYN